MAGIFNLHGLLNRARGDKSRNGGGKRPPLRGTVGLDADYLHDESQSGSYGRSERDTVQSEPTPQEMGQPLPPAPSYGEEFELCKLINERLREAEMHRRVFVRECVLAVAMYEDRQWLGWDETANQALSLMKDDEVDRYVTHNLIRPLIGSMVALSTMRKPDANAAPQSDSDINRAAAAEARAITAHLWRLHERQLQMTEVAWWAMVCGSVYLDDVWDPNAMATIAIPGVDGNVSRQVSAQIGEVASDVVPPFEVLIDPRAKRWKHARWIIRDQTLETGTIEERFGIKVEPDAENSGTWFDSYLPVGQQFGGVSSLGPWNRAAGVKRSARVMTMYERPTPEFPEGRTCVATKDRILYAGPMPMKDRNQYPLIRLVYEEAAAHPYGSGIMRSLIPLQVSLNRLLTKAVNHVESAKDTILDPKGSGSGADTFFDDVEESRTMRRVKVDMTMGEIKWQQALPVTADVWKLIDLTWDHMQHIAGVHDINQGQTTNGVQLSGVGIDYLQQGDRTKLGLFTTRIEAFAVERDSVDIELYAQNASGDIQRLMGLDDTGNPQVARTQIMAFKALTAGGAVSVVVRPGSATPKSAEGEIQEVYEMFKMGLFDPSNPAAEIAVRMLSLPKSDIILDAMLRFRTQIAQAMAQQQASQPPPPNPAAVAQIKESGETQRLQMQHEADKASTAQQFDADVAKSQAQNQQELDLAKQKGMIQLVVDAHKAGTGLQSDIAKSAMDHARNMHMGSLDHDASMQHKAVDHATDLHAKSFQLAADTARAQQNAEIAQEAQANAPEPGQ